jgi:hypothetical protein
MVRKETDDFNWSDREQNEKDKQLSINFKELGGHLYEDSKIQQIIDRIT